MKELLPSDRPREKLARHGVAALGDNELVALVLGSGGRRTGALALANELLVAHGGLHGLVKSTCDDLTDVSGIGPARASQILAALELGRRTLAHAPSARPRIRSPREAAEFLMPTFGARASEQFGIVLLDSKHRVIRTTVVALGTLNTTVVEPRDVFREAVAGRAAAIVVFHNHPSGDPTPSAADVDLTRRLAAAGALMGVDLVDHIVLADVRYCSFKEMGQL
jgi:DNA repair protein RadC